MNWVLYSVPGRMVKLDFNKTRRTMNTSIISGSLEDVLSRSEMKNIMAGSGTCATGCLNLYGGYHSECDSTYSPSSDERAACHDEVLYLNQQCINDC